MKKVVRWKPEFGVGVDVIDNQHKILYDLANDLNSAVNGGANMQVIDTLFNVIINYAYKHFETEEDLLKGDENHVNHCQEHYKMLKSFNTFVIEFHNGRRANLDLAAYLDGWLSLHIKENDLPAFSEKPVENFVDAEIDTIDEFDSTDVDSRIHKRLRTDVILDEDIVGHCFNATKSKNGSVTIVDFSTGGMKLVSTNRHDVDDLLIVSCKIGPEFQIKEKVRVKNVTGADYGVEFVSADNETVTFLTELCGASI